MAKRGRSTTSSASVVPVQSFQSALRAARGASNRAQFEAAAAAGAAARAAFSTHPRARGGALDVLLRAMRDAQTVRGSIARVGSQLIQRDSDLRGQLALDKQALALWRREFRARHAGHRLWDLFVDEEASAHESRISGHNATLQHATALKIDAVDAALESLDAQLFAAHDLILAVPAASAQTVRSAAHALSTFAATVRNSSAFSPRFLPPGDMDSYFGAMLRDESVCGGGAIESSILDACTHVPAGLLERLGVDSLTM